METMPRSSKIYNQEFEEWREQQFASGRHTFDADEAYRIGDNPDDPLDALTRYNNVPQFTFKYCEIFVLLKMGASITIRCFIFTRILRFVLLRWFVLRWIVIPKNRTPIAHTTTTPKRKPMTTELRKQFQGTFKKGFTMKCTVSLECLVRVA